MQGDDVALVPLTDEEQEQVKIMPGPSKARMTVVESVYHQLSDGPPSMLYRGEGYQFCREIDSDEDAYERRCVAKAEWTPLECGWLERCSHLLLRNDYAPSVRQPDASDAEAHTLEITFSPSTEPILILVPGESQRVHPANLKKMMIRGRVTGVRYTLCLVPE